MGEDFDGFDRTVDAHVSGLRRKLSNAGSGEAKLIETVYGSGYRLVHTAKAGTRGG